MPKMDGLTVMEQCSHDQTVKETAVFYCGFRQWGRKGSQRMPFNLGADYYMLKPF